MDLPYQYELKDRFIPRDFILSSIGSHEVIESYPQDEYLPNYLIYDVESQIFHILFAADQENNTVTILQHINQRDKWENDFKTGDKMKCYNCDGKLEKSRICLRYTRILLPSLKNSCFTMYHCRNIF